MKKYIKPQTEAVTVYTNEALAGGNGVNESGTLITTSQPGEGDAGEGVAKYNSGLWDYDDDEN